MKGSEVPYKTENGVICVTPCPYIKGDDVPMVGSSRCMMCVSYLKKDKKNKVVHCNKNGKESGCKYQMKGKWKIE